MTGLYFPEKKWLELKCRYVDCAWGMGLAGRGICEAHGLWFTSHCPGYETDEELEEEWRERDANF